MAFVASAPAAQTVRIAATSPAPTAASASPAIPPVNGAQQVDAGKLHYTIIGNRLLAPGKVAGVLQSATAPQEAIADLKRAYEHAGYFLVALVGEEQGNAITIHVIQGRITHVQGPAALVRFFSGLRGLDTVRKPDVVRRTLLAQEWAHSNDQELNVTFHPAPEPGGSILQLTATPLAGSHLVGGSLTFGNYGNRYAGRYLAQGNVTAHHGGFNASLGYARALPGLSSTTHGSFYQSGSAQLSWTTPLGIWALDGSTTRYRLGRAFAPLYPKGGVDTFGLSSTQLLYADAARRWSLSGGIHHIHENESVFAGTFSLYDHRYTVANLGTDASWRFTGLAHQAAAIQAGLGVKHSLGGSGAPKKDFTLYTANASLTQALPRNWQVKLALSGQTAPDTLPPYEQWVLGGLGNLSAYMPGTVVGDKGYLARVQLNAPQWKWGDFTLQPEVYAETGSARFHYIAPGAPRHQTLSDAGIGLHLGLPAAHLTATLAAAAPLGSHGVDHTFREGQRIHVLFLLQASF